MSGETPNRRFVYRASAVGIGGRITEPAYREIPAQAATSLPPDGGHATARVDGFSFEGFLHANAAYTVVTGNPIRTDGGARVHRTVTTVTVDGLNIDGVVTADKVVGRMVSEQPEVARGPGVLAMVPTGSYFVNLRIRGIPVDVQPHAHLLETSAGSRASIEAAESLHNPYGQPVRSKERLLFSIFGEGNLPKQLEQQGIERHSGWRIDVPDFGSVYLGERHVAEDHQLLIMLRVVLGSPRKGILTTAALEGDGHFP